MKILFLTALGLLSISLVSVLAIQRKIEINPEASDAMYAGIQFESKSFSDVLLKAKEQDKLIFIDAYASWCGPCKMLKRKTFPDPVAGEFFNRNFISVAIDVEKGEGPAVAAKYGVNAYPTLIITDASGAPVAITKGFMEAEQLIEFGTYALARAGKK
jgi:thiol:disulfide interchange protein